MMKQRGTVLVPTLMALEGGKAMIAAGSQPPAIEAKMRLAIETMSKTFKNALAKGVTIGLGTDAAVYPHGRNAEEFHQMVDLGMEPINALRAGTSIDAKLLGIDGYTGTLAAGKMADIVVIPGDPATNIRNIEKVMFVMKEGVIHLRR
jgi:imidazolonepropionase-like amidohydrolase